MSQTAVAPVQVIRHVCFEGVGTIGGELARLGLAFDYLSPSEQPLTNAFDARLLVVMGGPISANDVDRFPFLNDEIDLIRYRIENRLPTLGICLGAQLIAKAMGATVAPMVDAEIGWESLDLTGAGQTSPLKHLASPVLHWHGETFDLPAGFLSLAATQKCRHQAFAVEHHTLALQFHIEVTGTQLEHWLVGHVHELDRNGISVPKLREDARRFAESATVEGSRLLRGWLAACQVDLPEVR